MVALGIVKDLAVIMMLRVNDVSHKGNDPSSLSTYLPTYHQLQVNTKTLLGKALFNLMVREDTRELVDGQDVTQSLLRLVKLQVPDLSLISIQV